METAKDCADVRSFREQLERLSLQMKEQSRKKGQKRNGVALMTMHGAKGLEFRAVFLPSLVEGIVPHEKGMDTVAEERRLFYVAMTRASEKLCLSAILQRYEKERKPSRFLAEMGLDAEMAFRKNKEKEEINVKPKDKYRMKRKLPQELHAFGGSNGAEFSCAVSGLWHY